VTRWRTEPEKQACESGSAKSFEPLK